MLAAALPISRVQWPSYVRLISSRYPPIDLFDDVADPADWEALCEVESLTNPRIAETIGALDKVPVDRRLSGAGASWVMAPFTHASPDYSGRFHDGDFGTFYAASRFETAVAEVAYHRSQFLAATSEPQTDIELRELVGKVDAGLHDLRLKPDKAVLDPNDYTTSQALARALKASGSDGLVYPSVRDSGSTSETGGECIAAFYPDVVQAPQQAGHWSMRWDGSAMRYIKSLSGTLTGERRLYTF